MAPHGGTRTHSRGNLVRRGVEAGSRPAREGRASLHLFFPEPPRARGQGKRSDEVLLEGLRQVLAVEDDAGAPVVQEPRLRDV
eukprot:3914439-Pyramimonas_sp.AAC.1